MANTQNLYARISASAESFMSTLDSMANKTDKTASRIAKDAANMSGSFSGVVKAGNKLSSIGSGMKNFAKPIENVGSKMTNSITKPTGIAAGAVGGLVGALGFKRLIGMDDAQAKIQGLGYSGKEVTSIQGDVTKAIEGSMTTMAEGTDAAAGALGSGVKQGKELQTYIKGVGNAAQGAGVPVNEMAQIFSRVRGTNKLATEELQMMEERLPGFSSTLAKSLGVSYEEMRTMVTNGEVDFDDFMGAVDKRAGASSKAVAQSFRGMAMNSLNYIGMIGQAFLEPAFKEAKVILADVVNALNSDELRAKAGVIGSQVAPIFTFLTKAVVGTIKGFLSLPDPVLKVVGALGLLAVGAGPVMLAFAKITSIIGTLFGPLGTLVSTLGTVMGAISKTGGVVAGLSSVFPKLAGAFTLLSGPVGWIIAGVIALGTAFVIAYQKSETFRNFINGIGALFGRAIGWIKQFSSAIGSLFSGNTQEGTSLLKRLGFSPEQVSLIQGIVTQLKGIFSIFGQSLKTIFGGIKTAWNGVISLFSGSGSFIAQAFSNIITILTPIFQAISNIVRNSITQVLKIVKSVFQIMRGVMQVFGGLFKGDWRMVWAGIKNIFWGALNGIIALVKLLFMNMVYAVLGIVKMWVASLRIALGVLKNVFVAIWNGIKFVTLYIWNGIKNAVITSVQTLRLRATQILNALKFAISAIWNGIKFVSIAVWNGIKWAVLNAARLIKSGAIAAFNGLKLAMSTIFNAIKFIATSIWNGIKWAVVNAVRGAKNIAIATFNILKASLIAIFNGIKFVTTSVWNGIKWAVVNAARGLKNIALATFRLLKAGVIAIWNGIKYVTSTVWNWIKNRVIALARILRSTVVAVFNALRSSITAIWNGIKAVTSAVWNWIKNRVISLARTLRSTVVAVFNALRSSITGIWNAIKSITSAAWNWIKNKVIALARGLRNTVVNVFNAFKNTISNIWNAIKGFTSRIWNGIKNTVVSLATGLKNAVVSRFNTLKNAVSGIWNKVKSTAINMWQGIKDKITGFATGIKDGVVGTFGKMRDSLEKIIGKIKGFVSDMVDKVKTGLNNLIDGVNWVGEKLGMGEIGHVKMHTGTSSGGSVTRNGKLSKDVMATVGDKGKGNGPGGFRHETVIPPRGKPFITPNTDSLMPAKKGTQIMNGAQTHAMLSAGTHAFAKGTGVAGGKKPKKAKKGDNIFGDVLEGGKALGGKVLDGGKAVVDKTLSGVKKGKDWLGGKVKDVMDFIDKPEKLLEHVLKGFGVGFDLAENTIPADMMKGMFKKLKQATVDKFKAWFEESGEGEGGWVDISKGINFPFSPSGHAPGYPFAGPHMGVDLNYKYDKLYSTHSGKATAIPDDGSGFGNHMSIKNGALELIYGHMSKLAWKGTKDVHPGSYLGVSGNTGKSSGPHLHYEMRKNGKAIDPMPFLKKQSKGGSKSGKKWASTIKKALAMNGLPTSSAYVNAWAKQIDSESGGNPKAVQGGYVDANTGGNEAKGLVQVAKGTFNQYKRKGHGNIFNPLDNLLAGIGYAKSRYGGSMLSVIGKGHGYANGGIIDAPEMAWLAEGGFSESVISHDPRNRMRSKAIHDKTGQMLGIDTDTQLLQEIVNLLEFNNDLSIEGNANTRTIANKNQSINIDGKTVASNTDKHLGNMAKNEYYNKGIKRG